MRFFHPLNHSKNICCGFVPHTLLSDSKMHGMTLNPDLLPTHTVKKRNMYTTNIQEGWSTKEVGTNFSGNHGNKDFTEKIILELTLNYEWDFSRFFFEEEWPGKEKSIQAEVKT